MQASRTPGRSPLVGDDQKRRRLVSTARNPSYEARPVPLTRRREAHRSRARYDFGRRRGAECFERVISPPQVCPAADLVRFAEPARDLVKVVRASQGELVHIEIVLVRRDRTDAPVVGR